MASTATPTPKGAKFCHIVKRADFDGYGFNLHSEKIKPGQFIGKVDANSPASAAGLKEGDRIVEVNGVPIGNDTHKQVVQRIKANANEVRLLLIDADAGSSGNGVLSKKETPVMPKTPSVGSSSSNNNNSIDYQGSVQQMPGASANISTISMISTKRMSSGSSNGSQMSAATAVAVPPPMVPAGADVTDRSYVKNGDGTNGVGSGVIMSQALIKQQQQQQQSSNNNVITPLPPSATIESLSSTSSNGIKAGSLQLPMTAAEMRAKLLAKKKFDPKNEGVDLKKKFDIIQKL